MFSLFSTILLVIITVIGLFLAFWVYFSDKESEINKSFTLFTASILLWINLGYLYNLMQDSDSALLVLRLTFGAISLFFISAYFFSIYFPKKGERNKLLEVFIPSFLGVLSLLSIFTDLIIESVEIKDWGVDFTYGSLGPFFLTTVIVLTFVVLWQFFKKYFNLTTKEKLKVQYFLVGILIFALMNLVFNVILPIIRGTIEYYQFGNYSAIFLLGFTSYAVIKKEMFQIRVVLTGLMVSLIAILLGVDLIFFTKEAWMQVAKGGVLIIFIAFGYFLVKSVIREIERKEELEKLSDELVETNIKLKEANKKLRKLDKAKSEFISIASHQLRTPLTAIKGYLSMIAEGSYGEVSDQAKEKMESVLGSSERLISLVNDLLNVSRIESGKIEMDFKKVNLKEFIQDSVKELQIVAEEEGLYLKHEIEEDLIVSMDEDRIRQVVLNIIDNAIKYTDEGGITITAKKQELKSGKDSALIKIEDTGEGMTRKDIDNIFDSFSRGSAGDLMHAEGAGLGLYIAKKFVDMHKGSIWIESDGKGEGTCFFIELPLKQS